MSTFFRRPSGVVLILLALAGLIVSMYGMWRVIGLKENLIPKIESGLDLVRESLNTTNQALNVVDSTLETVSQNITTMRDALQALAQSIHDASPTFGSLSTLAGKTLPDTLTATQASLVTAQTTAKTIEDILSAITRIPLMPGEPYNPEVPLYVSLGQVASDLDEIQPQLKTMQQDLVESKMDLYALESDTLKVSEDLLKINTNLADAEQVVNQYQELIKKLQTSLDAVEMQIPGVISISTGFLIFILFWIVLYQFDLFLRGIKLIRAKE